MKKTAILLLAALPILSGCRSLSYTAPDGRKLTLRSFGNKTSWADFEMGDVKLTNFNNDQVSGIQAVGQVAAQAAAIGMMAAKQATNAPAK